jgi:predicted nucleic acid-binding protein
VRKIFFDSSVYVKAFTQESGTETVSQLFQLAYDKRIQILLSVWAINETIGAVDRKHRRREITESQKDTIIATIFQRAITWSEESSDIAFVPLHPIIVEKSRDFIVKLHISPDDAFHLYTAFIKRCEYFICHDIKLKKNVEGKFPDMKVLDISNATELNMLRKSLEP